jgi:hypothetical protein
MLVVPALLPYCSSFTAASCGLTKLLERETGIEPATNSLEGCDSTTELLPPALRPALRTGFIKNLELMTRIELVTSPLPRECSTN